MKIRDAIMWPRHWTTPLGNETHDAPVDDGVLFDIRGWEDTSTIVLVVRCPSGKYYGTISTVPHHYETLVQFLSMNKKRKLREIKQSEITFPEAVS